MNTGKLSNKARATATALNKSAFIPRTLKDKAFAALIQNEDDWQIDKHYAYHKPSDIKWWIANGLLFFGNSEDGKNSVSIGLWNKIKLYYWIKDVQRKQVIRSVCGA